MATVLQKIKDIENEMARTQKNKATVHHLGVLKAKLAKLRREILTPVSKGGSGAGEGFDVTKSGDSRVGLVGFPSVGKSMPLNKLTRTFSEVASYELTTVTCIPGVVTYRGAKIQGYTVWQRKSVREKEANRELKAENSGLTVGRLSLDEVLGMSVFMS